MKPVEGHGVPTGRAARISPIQMVGSPGARIELRALLDQERVIPPVSASQRARAMARARAALATPLVATTATSGAALRPRWAVAAAAGLLLSAAIAAAYEVHARFTPAPMTRPAAAVSAPPF